MAQPLTLPSLSDIQVTEIRQLYDTTTHAKLRLRAQIVLLAHQGRSVTDIATVVFRSRDTVERVLKRFLQGGSAALPPHTAPGRAPTVTPEWQVELLRVIDLDPHTVGVHSANWTTRLLATYLAARPRWQSRPRPYACICTPLAGSASGQSGSSNAKPKRSRATWETPAG